MGRFLVKINRQPGRGSEHRFVQEVFAKGERLGASYDKESLSRPRLTRADFHALYSAELAEGKFWGVEHDLRELRGLRNELSGLSPAGHGLATPSEGPCQLRFDYIYFSMLELRGVREILSGLRCRVERSDVPPVLHRIQPLQDTLAHSSNL